LPTTFARHIARPNTFDQFDGLVELASEDLVHKQAVPRCWQPLLEHLTVMKAVPLCQLVFRLDLVGSPFADDHAGRHRVSGCDARHHRGIGGAKSATRRCSARS
jgi:hypothetical protein